LDLVAAAVATRAALIAMLFAVPALAADQRIIASSTTASINADLICAAAIPKAAKRIPVADGCVVVRQQRAGQRSCEYVMGPDSTLADYDRMVALCKRTELP
jgi:hypothetical protein